jgi:hypothetical protein
MIYVVVDTDGKHTVVHGPFHSEYAARRYAGKLSSHFPHKSPQVTYLIPEKNLSLHVASATPSDIMDVP